MGPLPAVQDTYGGHVPRCMMCQKRCSPLLTFPCHVVCASCLGLLVSHRDPGDVIECPECHRMYPFTDQWQRQFSNVQSLRNDHVHTDVLRRCRRCKTRRSAIVALAEQYCYQCQQPLCRHCHVTLHTSTRRRLHHIVVPLIPAEWALAQQAGSVTCCCPSTHEGQSLSLFCVTCRVALCGACADLGLEHAGHELWEAETSVKNAYSLLKGRLDTMEEHRKVLLRLLAFFCSLDQIVGYSAAQQQQLPVAAEHSSLLPGDGTGPDGASTWHQAAGTDIAERTAPRFLLGHFRKGKRSRTESSQPVTDADDPPASGNTLRGETSRVTLDGQPEPRRQESGARRSRRLSPERSTSSSSAAESGHHVKQLSDPPAQHSRVFSDVGRSPAALRVCLATHSAPCGSAPDRRGGVVVRQTESTAGPERAMVPLSPPGGKPVVACRASVRPKDVVAPAQLLSSQNPTLRALSEEDVSQIHADGCLEEVVVLSQEDVLQTGGCPDEAVVVFEEDVLQTGGFFEEVVVLSEEDVSQTGGFFEEVVVVYEEDASQTGGCPDEVVVVSEEDALQTDGFFDVVVLSEEDVVAMLGTEQRKDASVTEIPDQQCERLTRRTSAFFTDAHELVARGTATEEDPAQHEATCSHRSAYVPSTSDEEAETFEATSDSTYTPSAADDLPEFVDDTDMTVESAFVNGTQQTTVKSADNSYPTELADDPETKMDSANAKSDLPELVGDTQMTAGRAGEAENVELAQLVQAVFGESFSQHLRNVRTAYDVLDFRIERLAYELHSPGPCSSLSCLSTWVNARPVISEEVYNVLEEMFPESSAPCLASSTSAAPYYPQFVGGGSASDVRAGSFDCVSGEFFDPTTDTRLEPACAGIGAGSRGVHAGSGCGSACEVTLTVEETEWKLALERQLDRAIDTFYTRRRRLEAVSASAEDDWLEEVSAPAEDDWLEEVSAPAEDDWLEEVSAPAEDDRLEEVSAPAEDDWLEEVSAPDEDDWLEEVSAPDEDDWLEEVSAPDEDDWLEEVYAPDEDDWLEASDAFDPDPTASPSQADLLFRRRPPAARLGNSESPVYGPGAEPKPWDTAEAGQWSPSSSSPASHDDESFGLSGLSLSRSDTLVDLNRADRSRALVADFHQTLSQELGGSASGSDCSRHSEASCHVLAAVPGANLLVASVSQDTAIPATPTRT